MYVYLLLSVVYYDCCVRWLREPVVADAQFISISTMIIIVITI